MGWILPINETYAGSAPPLVTTTEMAELANWRRLWPTQRTTVGGMVTKYVVSVSIEVEADDDMSAAAPGYTMLNDEIPVELMVQGLASPARAVVLNLFQAKQLDRGTIDVGGADYFRNR